MVIFDDPGEAERTNVAIQEARTQLRVKPEFKFSKSSDTVRDGFFTAISAYKFSIRAIVIEKAKIYSPHLRTGPDSFYNFFVNMLIQHDGGRTAGSQYQN